MKRQIWPLLPAAGLLALVTAGCGGSANTSLSRPSPAALRTDMISAMKSATSTHISGSVVNGGQTSTVDLSLTKSGDASGSVTVNGGSIGILTTQGHSYVQMSAATMKSLKLPTTACAVICGKYVELPASQAQSLTGQLTLDSLINGFSSKVPKISYSGSTTIDGQAVWKLRDSDGSTAYVTVTSPHYLIQVTPPAGQTGALTFGDWNSVTIPPPPPASKVVDLSKLGGL